MSAEGSKRSASGTGGRGERPRRFGRDRRLRKRSEFLRAQQARARAARGPVVVLVHLRADDGPARLGVVASRKVGGAVHRNRGKRRVREWFRRLDWLEAGIDLVVILRPGAANVPSDQLCACLEAATRRAVRASGGEPARLRGL